MEEFRQNNWILVPAVPDALREVAECLDLLWVTQISMQLSGVKDKIAEKKKQLPELRRLMRKRLELQQGYFLKYSPSEEIIRFFQELGEMEVQRAWGWDEFPREVKFGGIQFGCYCDWAFALATSMLMHAQFVIALCEQDEYASRIDLISLILPVSKNVQQAQSITGLSNLESLQVVRTLAMGPWNWMESLAVARGPVAPQYALGSDFLVRSFAGCTVNPIDFMLRELERCNPDDWARNVNVREDEFRFELGRLLKMHEKVIILPKNLWIKSSLGKTDIDMVIVDTLSGVVGLIQLKWQRMLSADMKARRTQGGNLIDDANKWVAKVKEWSSEEGMKEALSSAGLGRRATMLIKDVRIFVVGRHFSGISGGSKPSEEAAWGNWWQIRRLVLLNHVDRTDPIRSLYAALISDTSKERIQGMRRAMPDAQLIDMKITVMS